MPNYFECKISENTEYMAFPANYGGSHTVTCRQLFGTFLFWDQVQEYRCRHPDEPVHLFFVLLVVQFGPHHSAWPLLYHQMSVTDGWFHFIMPNYFECKISENTEYMADLPWRFTFNTLFWYNRGLVVWYPCHYVILMEKGRKRNGMFPILPYISAHSFTFLYLSVCTRHGRWIPAARWWYGRQ